MGLTRESHGRKKGGIVSGSHAIFFMKKSGENLEIWELMITFAKYLIQNYIE